MSSFGQRIREARKARKISLRKLAADLNISFTYLSKFESGEIDPPAEDKILALAERLELDPDELFSLAERVPSDLKEPILRPHMPRILRASKDLSDEQIEEMLEWVSKRSASSESS